VKKVSKRDLNCHNDRRGTYGRHHPDRQMKEAKLNIKYLHGWKGTWATSFNKWRVAIYTAPTVKIDENYVPQIVGEYRTKTDVVNGKFVYSIEK